MVLNKKGVMQQLGALGVGIAGLTITLTVVFLIIGGVKSNSTVAADGSALNATNTLQGAAATIPGWVPLVVIAVIGAILLSLVGMFMARR